ncbi:hypothetical protein LIER_27135 [Lithospermum erythrorhizon]|uniref:Uncharacterized protein n=1 Tax=Lithospermum erythrorhizon TaxID=34254 RepID=A0AAV3RC48_LITER
MGRGKIEIKRIENSSNRQVTYSKRRNGIMKKAKEITVLCDAKVSLIIFGSSGKMYEFISPGTTMIEVLDMYQKGTGKKLWDAKHENLSNEIERIKKENDGMQIELRHLKGEDIQSLTHKELMMLEDGLDKGLACIKDKQSEFVKIARKHEQMLEEENKQLMYEWALAAPPRSSSNTMLSLLHQAPTAPAGKKEMANTRRVLPVPRKFPAGRVAHMMKCPQDETWRNELSTCTKKNHPNQSFKPGAIATTMSAGQSAYQKGMACLEADSNSKTHSDDEVSSR